MAVVLKAPWRGLKAGDRVSLDDFSERQLVRGGSAEFAGAPVQKPAPLVKSAANRREHEPFRETGEPLTTDEPPKRRRGRPRKSDG